MSRRDRAYLLGLALMFGAPPAEGAAAKLAGNLGGLVGVAMVARVWWVDAKDDGVDQ